MVSHN